LILWSFLHLVWGVETNTNKKKYFSGVRRKISWRMRKLEEEDSLFFFFLEGKGLAESLGKIKTAISWINH
jgi:hypothetical protein